jgi:hypothetical protein
VAFYHEKYTFFCALPFIDSSFHSYYYIYTRASDLLRIPQHVSNSLSLRRKGSLPGGGLGIQANLEIKLDVFWILVLLLEVLLVNIL